jgi:hypothetical protein
VTWAGLTVTLFNVLEATAAKLVEAEVTVPVEVPVPVAVTVNLNDCTMLLFMVSVEVVPLIDGGLKVAVAPAGKGEIERFAVPLCSDPLYATVTE